MHCTLLSNCCRCIYSARLCLHPLMMIVLIGLVSHHYGSIASQVFKRIPFFFSSFWFKRRSQIRCVLSFRAAFKFKWATQSIHWAVCVEAALIQFELMQTDSESNGSQFEPTMHWINPFSKKPKRDLLKFLMFFYPLSSFARSFVRHSLYINPSLSVRTH